MNILAESENYVVMHEYERVILKDKRTAKTVIIGDFYGDPEVAVISRDEKYCVMGGCGVIMYYFTEPFEDYQYNVQSAQWKEWGRENPESIAWVTNISCVDDEQIEIETEDMKRIIFDVFRKN